MKNFFHHRAESQVRENEWKLVNVESFVWGQNWSTNVFFLSLSYEKKKRKQSKGLGHFKSQDFQTPLLLGKSD